jgi:hypothetical protein
MTAYGVCFAEGDRDYTSFPVDGSYDASDGLSKLVGKKIARSFASRTGADIYALGLESSPSPMTMRDFRRLSPTRSRGSETPGAISRFATSPEWSICAFRRTASAFRLSTPQMIRLSRRSRRCRSSTRMRRARREGVNLRASTLRCPIERRGSFWASGSCTAGENTLPVVIDGQPRRADHRCSARMQRSGRNEAASSLGLHSACG